MSIRPPKGRRFEDIKKGMKSPFLGDGGTAAAKAMRRGPGSIEAQFKAQAEFPRRGGRVPWKRTKAFGNRRPPAKTLQRTGALMRAWTDQGPGALTIKGRRKIAVGVDSARFPQAVVFQRQRDTLIRAKTIGAQGRYAMHWYLGMHLGVWISQRRLRAGLRIVPRRVSVNPDMMENVGNAVAKHLAGGAIPI
jgi:hypothetical protein